MGAQHQLTDYQFGEALEVRQKVEGPKACDALVALEILELEAPDVELGEQRQGRDLANEPGADDAVAHIQVAQVREVFEAGRGRGQRRDLQAVAKLEAGQGAQAAKRGEQVLLESMAVNHQASQVDQGRQRAQGHRRWHLERETRQALWGMEVRSKHDAGRGCQAAGPVQRTLRAAMCSSPASEMVLAWRLKSTSAVRDVRCCKTESETVGLRPRSRQLREGKEEGVEARAHYKFRVSSRSLDVLELGDLQGHILATQVPVKSTDVVTEQRHDPRGKAGIFAVADVCGEGTNSWLPS